MKFFAASFVLFSIPTFANVGVINYIGEAGTIWGQTNYSTQSTTSSILTSGTFGLDYKVADIESTTSSMSQELYYSVNDNFQIGLDWILSQTTKNDYLYGNATTLNGETRSNTTKGSVEPAVKLEYRFGDEKKYLALELSHSLGKDRAKSASQTKDGESYNGGDVTIFSLIYGKQKGIMETNVNFSVISKGESTHVDPDDNQELKVTYENSVSLIGMAQFNLGEKFALLIGGGVISNGASETTSNGTATTTDAIVMSAYEVGGKVIISPSVALGLSYGNATQLNLGESFSENLRIKEYEVSGVSAYLIYAF